MTRPFFSKERISHFEIFGRHADEAIELMKTRLRSGHAIDFQVCDYMRTSSLLLTTSINHFT